jgi:excisionase family DNA binding protein
VDLSANRERSLDWKAADVIDQLRAENESLEAENKRLDTENRTLRKEKQALAAKAEPQIEPQEAPQAGACAIGLREAAQLLSVSYSTVYEHRCELGFFQIGNQWRIWPETLRENLEKQAEKKTSTPNQTGSRPPIDTSPRSSRPVSGRTAEQTAAVRALDERLARKPPKRRA